MSTQAHLESAPEVSPTLATRWRGDLLERRRSREARKRRDEDRVPFPFILSRKMFYYRGLRTFLRCTGLLERGRRNYLNPGIVHNRVFLKRLPPAFSELRILQLADIHLDLDPALLRVIQERIAELVYDICVITGDFRDSLTQEGDLGIKLSCELIRSIPRPVYGCLGNHDLAEDLLPLEEAGLRMLVNESLVLERGGSQLALAGIDDAGYMETHDLEAALEGVPEGVCTVLLSHSPDAYMEAAARGVDFMLSGHTHGGQICLPGGRALMSHSVCPRAMIGGAWKQGHLQGYTSRGTGACHVAVRFHCPGEIVLHTLELPPS